MNKYLIEFYEKMSRMHSEEEIYENMILFIISNLQSKKLQYKNNNFRKLLETYYELIELKEE